MYGRNLSEFINISILIWGKLEKYRILDEEVRRSDRIVSCVSLDDTYLV